MGMAEELVVNISEDEEAETISRLGVIGVIWSELNGGVGPWGTFETIIHNYSSSDSFPFLRATF